MDFSVHPSCCGSGDGKPRLAAEVSHPPDPPSSLGFGFLLRTFGFYRPFLLANGHVGSPDALPPLGRRRAIGATARDASAKRSCSASARLSGRLRVRGGALAPLRSPILPCAILFRLRAPIARIVRASAVVLRTLPRQTARASALVRHQHKRLCKLTAHLPA